MKFVYKLSFVLLCALACVACTTNKPEPEPEIGSFAKGADIGWLTEMEHDGVKFYNETGTQTECISLLKSIGMNSVRLRVWVNPTSGWCNQADVLAKAERSKALKQRIMIDFHYSDHFADPGKQTKPAEWNSYTLDELKTAVSQHTTTVLTALKNKNIEPEWVQIGNETRNGMLWDDGRLWTSTADLNHWGEYAQLTNAGYEAAKTVFPNTTIIIHIDNAWEDNDWWFQKYKQNGGKMDMIGLSHYPQTHSSKTWKEMNDLCAEHIQSLSSKYHCKIMICEIGTKSANASTAAEVMQDFMTQISNLDSCAGVFYWEPQVYNNWKPAEYNTLGWGAYNMGAFTNAGKPTEALKILFQ